MVSLHQGSWKLAATSIWKRLLFLFRLLLRLRGPANGDDGQIRHSFLADNAIGRIEAKTILVNLRELIGHRDDLAVGADAVGLDDPGIVHLTPQALRVAPFGIEDPRLDLLAQGIATN